VQLLSVKIGEMLLVIGALHFANLVIFTRLRRRAQPPWQASRGAWSPPAEASERGREQPLAAGARGQGLQ
jgi:hypothetical protein